MNTHRDIAMACLAVFLLIACPAAIGQDEPDLPEGLAEPDDTPREDPDLPEGLDGGDEPDLPEGIDDGKPATDSKPRKTEDKTFLVIVEEWDLSGLLDVRAGTRTQPDRHEDDASIAEARLQLEWEKTFGDVTFKATGDFLYDPVSDRLNKVDLVRGTGWFDLRELWARSSPTEWMDVKVGRQVLTWGTADLLFVNDLFPKDWQAFFIGRDLEYLKAPTDAVKTSLFSDAANVDVVYMPRFNPSRFISGRRLSYYSPAMGTRAGQNAVIRTDLPNEWFDDSEWATRVSRKLGSYELAAYGYWGYWKTPEGFNPVRGRATYPRLSTYGASARGPAGRGIANAEAAWYDSRQDRIGSNPMVRNSEVRLLAGYETDLPELAPELTVGLQYYVEVMQDYSAYHRALPPGAKAADRTRHVLTARLTKKLLNQDLTLSVFGYYSPSDADGYLRPNVRYKIDDHWTAEAGSNIFLGKDNHTFFGQFERNSNVYASLNYAF